MAGAHLVISCRVNADEEGTEKQALEIIWVQLSNFIKVCSHFFAQWPGLFYNVWLVPMGVALYYMEKLDSDHRFPLMQCLVAARNNKDISVQDPGEEEKFLNVKLLFPFKGW